MLQSTDRPPSGTRPPSPWRKHRGLLLLVSALSVVVLGPKLGEVYGELESVSELSPWWLAVAVACEVASFVACWDLLRLLLRRSDWRAVASAQLAGNAVSQLVPAGAASGAALQLRMLTRSGIDAPTAVGGSAASGLLSTVGFLALPLLAVPAILSGAATDSTLEAGIWLSLGLLAALVCAAVVATRDAVVILLATWVEHLVHLVRRGGGPSDLAATALGQRDLLWSSLRSRGGRAAMDTFGQAIGGFLALYFTVMAAGGHAGITVVLAAYAVANVAGMIPITPGGIGFVEAGLAGVLTFGGVAPDTALVAVATYRIVSSWLPVLAGCGAFVSARALRRTHLPEAPVPLGTQLIGVGG